MLLFSSGLQGRGCLSPFKKHQENKEWPGHAEEQCQHCRYCCHIHQSSEMQRDAKKEKQMDADGNTFIFKHYYVFLPVYKLEDVDPINLEPQSSIKLRRHKVT